VGKITWNYAIFRSWNTWIRLQTYCWINNFLLLRQNYQTTRSGCSWLLLLRYFLHILVYIFTFIFLISIFIKHLSVVKSVMPGVALNLFHQVLNFMFHSQMNFPVPLTLSILYCILFCIKVSLQYFWHLLGLLNTKKSVGIFISRNGLQQGVPLLWL